MAGLKAWTQALNKEVERKEDADITMDTDAPAQITNKPGGDPKIKVGTLFHFYQNMSCYMIIA